MPFTSAQRAQVRLYLGWSDRFHQTDSRLEQAMNAIDGEPTTDTLTICTGLLASLADIDTRITGAYDRVKAVKVGTIELPGTAEIAILRSEGRRFSGRLAATLGVSVRHDVWSGSGPKAFASASGLGGNYPPLG